MLFENGKRSKTLRPVPSVDQRRRLRTLPPPGSDRHDAPQCLRDPGPGPGPLPRRGRRYPRSTCRPPETDGRSAPEKKRPVRGPRLVRLPSPRPPRHSDGLPSGPSTGSRNRVPSRRDWGLPFLPRRVDGGNEGYRERHSRRLSLLGKSVFDRKTRLKGGENERSQVKNTT